jgi:hypothetical protein
MLADPNGDIPVLARDEAALIQSPADGTDRLPNVVGKVRSGYPIP